jgi:omega-amidase
MKLCLIQLDLAYGDPPENMNRIAEKVARAARDKPDVVVLPEMWNTAYNFRELDRKADPEGQNTRKLLRELALTYHIHLVGGSVAEKRDRGIYNCTYVYNRQGKETAVYRKVHLFRLLEEDKFLTPGDALTMYDVEEARVGAAICYDLRFPEMFRHYALKGANMVIIPAQWPNPRLSHWRQLLIARAIENQLYVVGCNRVGSGGDHTFFGHSMVVSPWGDVLIEGKEEESILTVEVDLDEVERVRENIPVFQDRRADLYGGCNVGPNGLQGSRERLRR